MKTFAPLLSFVLLIYLLMCALLYFFQEKFIFFPPPANKTWYLKIKHYEYFITTASAHLHGWKISSADSQHNAIIIYFGGNAEDVSYNILDANLYATRHLFLTNMPGFGNSTGQLSEHSFFSNGLQIYDYIVKKYHLDTQNIFIMGRSLGSTVATYVASQRNTAGLILITPFDSIENIARKQYSLLPIKLLLKHKFSTEKYIDAVSAPIMVIATDNDGIIPAINLANLYAPRKQKINLLKINDANHINISKKKNYFTYINNFISAKH